MRRLTEPTVNATGRGRSSGRPFLFAKIVALCVQVWPMDQPLSSPSWRVERVSRAVFCPVAHEAAAFLEQGPAPIGGFDLIGDSMRKHHFGNFVGVAGLFGRPVFEGAPESVHRDIGALRRSSIAMLMSLVGRPARAPSKMRSPDRGIACSISSTRSLRGTVCGVLRPLSRSGGTVQVLACRSISDQRVPIAAPVRDAVRIVNSRHRADVPTCCGSAVMKAGISA
jgi:hypothetical protein